MALDVLNTPVKHFEDGGLTADVTPSAAGVPVTGVSSKYMPKTAGTTVLSPEETDKLLGNMQRLIDQKTGPMAQFMGGVQDALAYAQPYQGGQMAAALQYRNQQKQQEMKDLMEMQSNMSTYQSSMQQQQNIAKALSQEMGGGTGGAGTGGAGTGGAGTGDFGMTTSAEMPDAIRQEVEFWMKSGNMAKAQEALSKYRQTAGTEYLKKINNPAYMQQQKYDIPGVGGVMMNGPQLEYFNKTGVLPDGTVIKRPGMQGAAATAPQFRPEGTAEDIARGLGVPLTSGTRTPQRQGELYAQSQQPGYTGPVVAKPETSRHVTGDAIDVNMKTVTPEQIQALRDNGFKQTVKSEPWHWELPKAQQGKPEQYAGPITGPISGSAEPPKRRQGESIESYESRRKQWEQASEADIGARRIGTEEEERKAADYISSIESGHRDYDMIKKATRSLQKNAKDHPEDFSFKGQGGALGLLTSIPVAGEGVGSVYAATQPGMVNRRGENDASATALGVENAKNLFTGSSARFGAQLTGLGISAKGVGNELPPELNIKNARLMELTADMAEEQMQAWKRFKGKGNAFDFLQSPQNQMIEEKYRNKIQSEFPGIYKDVENKDVADAAARTFGAYEPDKYEYRLNKETNKIGRKPIGGAQ